VVERRRGQQIQLAAHRQIVEERRGKPRGRADGMTGGAEERVALAELGDRPVGILQHAALRMTHAPRELVVRVLAFRRFGSFDGNDRRGRDGSLFGCVRLTGQCDGRRIPPIGIHLHDTAARGDVLLQVRSQQVRTRRQIAEREAAILIGNRKCRRRAECGDDGAPERLTVGVLHQAVQFGVVRGGDASDRRDLQVDRALSRCGRGHGAHHDSDTTPAEEDSDHVCARFLRARPARVRAIPVEP
jgi:hypothetical protein